MNGEVTSTNPLKDFILLLLIRHHSFLIPIIDHLLVSLLISFCLLSFINRILTPQFVHPLLFHLPVHLPFHLFIHLLVPLLYYLLTHQFLTHLSVGLIVDQLIVYLVSLSNLETTIHQPMLLLQHLQHCSYHYLQPYHRPSLLLHVLLQPFIFNSIVY